MNTRVNNEIRIAIEKWVDEKKELPEILVLQTSVDVNAHPNLRKKPAIEIEYPAIEFE
jgi:hypothetical protein